MQAEAAQQQQGPILPVPRGLEADNSMLRIQPDGDPQTLFRDACSRGMQHAISTFIHQNPVLPHSSTLPHLQLLFKEFMEQEYKTMQFSHKKDSWAEMVRKAKLGDRKADYEQWKEAVSKVCTNEAWRNFLLSEFVQNLRYMREAPTANQQVSPAGLFVITDALALANTRTVRAKERVGKAEQRVEKAEELLEAAKGEEVLAADLRLSDAKVALAKTELAVAKAELELFEAKQESELRRSEAKIAIAKAEAELAKFEMLLVETKFKAAKDSDERVRLRKCIDSAQLYLDIHINALSNAHENAQAVKRQVMEGLPAAVISAGTGIPGKRKAEDISDGIGQLSSKKVTNSPDSNESAGDGV